MIYVTRWKRMEIRHTPVCLEDQKVGWVEGCGCPVVPIPPERPHGEFDVRLLSVVPCIEDHVVGYWEDRD